MYGVYAIIHIEHVLNLADELAFDALLLEGQIDVLQCVLL